MDLLGSVDILVSNAGIEGPVAPWDQLDEADYLATFDVNLHAASWLSARLLPHMAANGGGSMIFMSSLSALRGNAKIGGYSMTKAALAQLSQNIAVGWGHRIYAPMQLPQA